MPFIIIDTALEMSRAGRISAATPKSCSPKLTRIKETFRRRFSLPERNDMYRLRSSKSVWGSMKRTLFSANVGIQGHNEHNFQIGLDGPSANQNTLEGIDSENQNSKRRILSCVNDENLLHFAVSENDVKLVGSILEAGKVDVNNQRPPGLTPLHQGCIMGNLECVKLLVAAGADLNSVDWQGCSPTKLAVSHGHYEVAEYLLQNGSTIMDIRDGFQMEKRPPLTKKQEKQIKQAPFGNSLKVPEIVW